ncbi:hypothetical protein MMC18_006639, partial [Xylographa bjoerkii]|nr:hypothetical protein [Xylographa bjoerkii]
MGKAAMRIQKILSGMALRLAARSIQGDNSVRNSVSAEGDISNEYFANKTMDDTKLAVATAPVQ